MRSRGGGRGSSWAEDATPPGKDAPGAKGREEEKRTVGEKEKGVTVYVTDAGTKYHRAGCRFLSKSMHEIALGEAVKKYEPCSVCKPPVLGR